MSEPEETREGTPDKESSLIGAVIKSSLEVHGSLGQAARALSDLATKKMERIDRSRRVLDSALLEGTISEEQAKKELVRIREEREESYKEMLEILQLMAQLNRDADAARTLHVNRMMEKGKLDYDFHKHFTTLGTGSILFIAALSRVIFPQVSETEGLLLLFTAFALLVVSVMSAALAMRGATVDAVLGETSHVTERVSNVSWFCFSNGIIAFVSYVGINMAGLSLEREWTLPIYLLIGASVGALLIRIINYIVKRVRRYLVKNQQG